MPPSPRTAADPVALVRAGATRAEAARACNLSRQRVGQLCDAAGLPSGRSGRPSADVLAPRSSAGAALVELAVSLGLDPQSARHAMALGAALGGRAALRGALIDRGQAPGPIPDTAELALARAAVVGVDYRDGLPAEWHLDVGGVAARPAWRVVLVPDLSPPAAQPTPARARAGRAAAKLGRR